MAYQIGDVVEFDAKFYHPDTGALTDPTAVLFKYETPAGAETTLTYPDANLVKISTGWYRAKVTIGAGTAGAWKFKWATTGTFTVASPDIIRTVETTVF